MEGNLQGRNGQKHLSTWNTRCELIYKYKCKLQINTTQWDIFRKTHIVIYLSILDLTAVNAGIFLQF